VTEPNAAQAPEDADGAAEVPLVLLSHRGPVTFDRGESGRTASRGGGGFVTALAGLAEHLADAMWVCATSSAEDAAVVREADGQAVLVSIGAEPEIDACPRAGQGSALRIRMVQVDPAAHAAFYGVISNPLLWFIQHGLYGLAESPVITLGGA
jgi:trehalose 6-phosphate synthase